MSLERSWQIMNEYVVREEGMIDIEARIDNGRRLMVRYKIQRREPYPTHKVYDNIILR